MKNVEKLMYSINRMKLRSQPHFPICLVLMQLWCTGQASTQTPQLTAQLFVPSSTAPTDHQPKHNMSGQWTAVMASVTDMGSVLMKVKEESSVEK